MKHASVQPSYRSSRVRRWVAYLWREAIRESWRPIAPASAKPGMDIETGRKWWAFQPVAPQPQPKVADSEFAKRWTRQPIDWFILARLEQNKLQPSPEVDRATLIQRAALDLTGLRPSYEEVQEFIADTEKTFA